MSFSQAAPETVITSGRRRMKNKRSEAGHSHLDLVDVDHPFMPCLILDDARLRFGQFSVDASPGFVCYAHTSHIQIK